MSKRILLIDADILVYQIASSAERPVDWGDDLWTLHSNMNEAIPELERRIEDIKKDLQSEECIFALTTTTPNFRKKVYTKYKDNRAATRKPLVWKPLRDHLKQHHTVYERDFLEGDDCLGILATKQWVGNPERIIVSIDKDFKTIPGQFYNLNTKVMTTTTPINADYWFIMQTLTGDTTDGYPGCPGVGPKTAEKLLDGCCNVDDPTQEELLKAMWRVVVETYKSKGLGEGVALQMARCARILRAEDYDFTNKKLKLWEAPVL